MFPLFILWFALIPYCLICIYFPAISCLYSFPYHHRPWQNTFIQKRTVFSFHMPPECFSLMRHDMLCRHHSFRNVHIFSFCRDILYFPFWSPFLPLSFPCEITGRLFTYLSYKIQFRLKYTCPPDGDSQIWFIYSFWKLIPSWLFMCPPYRVQFKSADFAKQAWNFILFFQACSFWLFCHVAYVKAGLQKKTSFVKRLSRPTC